MSKSMSMSAETSDEVSRPSLPRLIEEVAPTGPLPQHSGPGPSQAS